MKTKEYLQCNHVGIRCSDPVAQRNSSGCHLPVSTGEVSETHSIPKQRKMQNWSRVPPVLFGGLKAMDKSNKSALEVLFTVHDTMQLGKNEAATHPGLPGLWRLP